VSYILTVVIDVSRESTGTDSMGLVLGLEQSRIMLWTRNSRWRNHVTNQKSAAQDMSCWTC